MSCTCTAKLSPDSGQAWASNWGPGRRCKLRGRRVAQMKTGIPLVHIVRCTAWSGSLTAASLVTLPSGALPFDRLSESRWPPLGGHAYATTEGKGMSTRKDGKGTGNNRAWEKLKGLPEALSRVNLNAAGIDVGRQQPLRGGVRSPTPSSRCESSKLTRRNSTAWPTGCWSAEWRRWRWSPPASTGYRCSGYWKSGAWR